MEIFLGGLVKLMIDPILIGICIFLCVIKISSLGKTIAITAVLYTILLALTSQGVDGLLIIQSIFASVINSTIIFSVYNKIFKKN